MMEPKSPQGNNDEGEYPDGLSLSAERRAYLTSRLSELLKDFEKLEALETAELEPAMIPFAPRSVDHGAA